MRCVYKRIAARPAIPAKPATALRPAAPVYVAIGCLVASGDCHDPVPLAAPVAAATPVEAATGVLLRVDGAAEPEAQADQLASLEASTGLLVELAVVEQDVEVLVQTGTETVHGQSVTVRVVEPVTV